MSTSWVETDDGAQVAAWAVGPPEAPPIVLITGAGADHRGWRRMVPDLCQSAEELEIFSSGGPSLASAARVAVFDQRGTGASRGLAPATSAEVVADDAVAVGKATLGEPFALVGISHGGMAALHVALKAPSAVIALVLIATTAGGRGQTLPDDAVINNGAALFTEWSEGLVREGRELLFSEQFRKSHQPIVDRLVAEALAAPPTESDWLAQASIFASHDVADRLESIAVPTLVICGTADLHQPFANSEFLADGIPGAVLMPIPGAAHGLHMEAADELVAEVIQHVEH